MRKLVIFSSKSIQKPLVVVTPTFGPHPLYCQYTAADEPELVCQRKG